MLPQMHARLATKALDLFEALEDEDQKPDWELIALVPMVEAFIALSRSELLARRWKPERLAHLIIGLDHNWSLMSHISIRISWLTLAAAWVAPRLGAGIDLRSAELCYTCARIVGRRGNAWFLALHLAEAIRNYDAVIRLMEGLREALAAQGLAWPPDYQNELAMAYINRGNPTTDAVGPAAAIGDYDAAIQLMEGLREALAAQGLAWPPDYQNELARAYVNHGKATMEAVGPAAAIGDFDAAISLMEGLRKALAAQGLASQPNYQSDNIDRGSLAWIGTFSR